MKAIVIILVVLGLGLAAMYFYGGYGSFDPAQEGKEARAAIKPGMSLKQVLDTAGGSPKCCHIIEKTEVIGGQPVETLSQSWPTPLKRKKLEREVADNEVPYGFVLQYKFTETVAFEVAFDSTGTVTEVRNLMTVADLLGTKE